MPLSLQEVLDHAEEFAARSENYEPNVEDERDPASLRALYDAVVLHSGVQ